MSTTGDDAAPAEKSAAPAVAGGGPSAEAVEAYLRAHPDFLSTRPELMAALVPPEVDRGNGVVDLQHFMLQRLKSELAQLRTRERALLSAAEANAGAQARVHQAARALLAARSFQHLIRVVVDELPGMVDVAAVGLCVENSERLPGEGGETGVMILQPGMIDSLVGTDRPIALRPATDSDRLLFGARAARVRSVALLRLTFGPDTPAGLFALASAAPDGFDPRQGTDLLAFLAHVLQLCIRRWLGLPN